MASNSLIRLVTFDILHTLITPRAPIHVQYAEAFRPFLGALAPDDIKKSFRTAFKQASRDFPAYERGHEAWWAHVVKNTALGAGADPKVLNDKIRVIVPLLLKRFSSKEGYEAFDDAIPTIIRLHEAGIGTGIISNGDSRFRLVLKDLGFPEYIHPVALSEELKIEKPNVGIFQWALDQHNGKLQHEEPLKPEECLHVGDELSADYHGALKAGFQAVLVRRPGKAGEQEAKEVDEDVRDVAIVESLADVLNSVNG